MGWDTTQGKAYTCGIPVVWDNTRAKTHKCVQAPAGWDKKHTGNKASYSTGQVEGQVRNCVLSLLWDNSYLLYLYFY